MPARVAAFWEDEPGADGFAKVTRMHHQPDKLDAATLARGVVCEPGKPPAVRQGWTVALWVRPEDGACEWRTALDPDFREPIAEYLMRLPVMTRVQARASDDPVLVELLRTMDLLVQDASARGIHPGGRASRECLGYLVRVGLLDAAVMDDILSPVEPV
jgi:hypothetical protein